MRKTAGASPVGYPITQLENIMKYKLYSENASDRKTGKYLGWSVEADTPEEAIVAARIHRTQVRRSNAMYTDYGKRLDHSSYLEDENGRTFSVKHCDPWSVSDCFPDPLWDFAQAHVGMGDAIGDVRSLWRV